MNSILSRGVIRSTQRLISGALDFKMPQKRGGHGKRTEKEWPVT